MKARPMVIVSLFVALAAFVAFTSRRIIADDRDQRESRERAIANEIQARSERFLAIQAKAESTIESIDRAARDGKADP